MKNEKNVIGERDEGAANFGEYSVPSGSSVTKDKIWPMKSVKVKLIGPKEQVEKVVAALERNFDALDTGGFVERDSGAVNRFLFVRVRNESYEDDSTNS